MTAAFLNDEIREDCFLFGSGTLSFLTRFQCGVQCSLKLLDEVSKLSLMLRCVAWFDLVSMRMGMIDVVDESDEIAPKRILYGVISPTFCRQRYCLC